MPPKPQPKVKAKSNTSKPASYPIMEPKIQPVQQNPNVSKVKF